MEFLMGRSLLNTLYNLGIKDQYMGEGTRAPAAAAAKWCWVLCYMWQYMGGGDRANTGVACLCLLSC
jgi:hypothetical protein